MFTTKLLFNTKKKLETREHERWKVFEISGNQSNLFKYLTIAALNDSLQI